LAESRKLITALSEEEEEEEDKPYRYFSVCNNKLAVRYRFLPAILIEFPNDDCSD
jgi:hypothetical protein